MLCIIMGNIHTYEHIHSFKTFTSCFSAIISPKYSNMRMIKIQFVYIWSIMISMKCSDGSVHQHHLFSFVKFSIASSFIFIGKTTLRCHIQWYLTMDFATANLLIYVIFDVCNINNILIIFIWYIGMRKIGAIMNNILPILYVLILNVKCTHCSIGRMF